MTNEELVAEAAMFRSTLPFPDDDEVRARLEQCVLHDLLKVLRACCSEEHPLSPAKKTAGMFFFGAIVKGEPYLEEMKLYDTLPSERRAQIDSAWDGVIAAVEPAEAPPFLYLAALRQADQASGMRTFDRAVGAFNQLAHILLGLDEKRSEDDRRDLVREIYYDLYAQPDDMAYVEAALATSLGPGWSQAGAWNQKGFQFLQYFHHDGRQLDVNVGRHVWVVVGGPSGSYSGGAWREELVRELAAAFGPGGSAG